MSRSRPASPESFREVVRLWPGYAALEADTGARRGAAALWAHRDVIPVEYWSDVVEGAKRRGIGTVTPELLTQLARRPRGRRGAQRSGAAA